MLTRAPRGRVQLARLDREVAGLEREVNASARNVSTHYHTLEQLAERQEREVNASHAGAAELRRLRAAIRAGDKKREAAHGEYAKVAAENKKMLKGIREVSDYIVKTYAHTAQDTTETVGPKVITKESVSSTASALLEEAASPGAGGLAAEVRAAMEAARKPGVDVGEVMKMPDRTASSVEDSDKEAADLEAEEAAAWSTKKARLSKQVAALLKKHQEVSHALTGIARSVEHEQALHKEAVATHKELRHVMHARANLLDATRDECSRKYAVHKAESAARDEDLAVLGKLSGMVNGYEERVESKEEEVREKRKEEQALKAELNRPRVRSCLELLELGDKGRATHSGVYMVYADPADKESAYRVYCDQETAGGGWTLTAVVANDARDYWRYTGRDGDMGDVNSLWESGQTLGNLTARTVRTARDFKSHAFVSLPADEVMLTHNGAPLLRTQPGCLQGRSLRDTFRQSPFSCAGARYECHYGTGNCRGSCHHACGVAQQFSAPVEDVVTGGRNATALLLKAGAAVGAQDGNMNRAYLSTLPSRLSVDYPEGLGVYKGFNGVEFAHDMGLHRATVSRPYHADLYNAIFVREAVPQSRRARHADDSRPSCAAHRRAGRTASGLYTLRPEGGNATFPAYCDMETAGGGWTLVAVVANAANEHWTYSDSDGAAGQVASLWENAKTLGTLSAATHRTPQDFKSPAYLAVVGDEVMVTHKTRPMLRTRRGCLGQRTMRHRLNTLEFACRGDDRVCDAGPGRCAADGGCTHTCPVAEQFAAPARDALVAGRNATELWLKAGAAEKAQDFNKERAYLSTREVREGKPHPAGLGAFVGFLGRTFSHNMAVDAKGVHKPKGAADLFNAIYVR